MYLLAAASHVLTPLVFDHARYRFLTAAGDTRNYLVQILLSHDFLSWLYIYCFSRFDMFMHYFVNCFVILRTNYYTLLTISQISFIFDSARKLTRNLPYRPLWRFVKILIAWWEWQNVKWEKWLARQFTKCHLYTSHFSRFANIFSRFRQFDDKCIDGFRVIKRVVVGSVWIKSATHLAASAGKLPVTSLNFSTSSVIVVGICS